MQELPSKVAKVATILPSPNKQSLEHSTIRRRENTPVAWNPGKCGTSARLETPPGFGEDV